MTATTSTGIKLVSPADSSTPLQAEGDKLLCPVTGKAYEQDNGCWDLIEGERFHDEYCECMWCNEESTGRHLSDNYVVPLLKREFAGRDPGTLKILSIGCGVGSDVEALNEAGYIAHGIDAGNRSQFWARRKFPDRYFLANAKHLPFDTASFDVILMGCVLPHIGVGDEDSYVAQPGHEEERQQAADEMVRVTREGGQMVITSPNRLCPLDFFHRADVRKHTPRWHPRDEDFLLSADDYRRLLKVGDACNSLDVLPLRGYWGFYSSSTYLLGRILQMPVRFYFNHLMSWRITHWLRETWMNPWLIMQVKR